MDHPGGSSQPAQHPASSAAALRRAWGDGIAAIGPSAELPGLRSLLDGRLIALEQRGTLDEPSLLGVAEEAAHLALETGSAELARTLSKRLRRSIYEFLLALDAAPATSVPSAPVAPLTPVAPVEPGRPARWGQVLIGVEEAEAAQRAGGDPALNLDLGGAVGSDDTVTAEVARAIARSESEPGREHAWNEAEAGRLVDLADAATEEVGALRSLLEEAMAQGVAPEPPSAHAAAAAAAQAYAAVVAEARAAAEAEALRAAEAEAARVWAEAEALAGAMLRDIEDAEEAAARAVLLRLRLMEALPPPGLLDPEAMRVPPTFRRDALPAPAAAARPEAPPPAPPAALPTFHAPPAPPAAPPAALPTFHALPAPPPPPAALPTFHAPPAPPPPPAPVIALPTAPSLYPIAPRDGFHLTDPSMVGEAIAHATAPPPTPAPAAPPTPALAPPPTPAPALPGASRWNLPTPPPAPPVTPTSAAAADAQPEVGPSAGPGGWSVRQSPRQQKLTERMAQKRREEAVRAAQEAASIATALAEPERRRRRGKAATPERIVDVTTARELVEEQLRRKRGAEAAALLQRLAAELPGRETSDLALDSGDRCLALGQNRSATNCYLAGWRADPGYEAPLWRLADVCLADREVALATGYLERIAELMRTRGDHAGALAVYRKIVTIAPEREDIRRLLRLEGGSLAGAVGESQARTR
ncbi:MAG: hypothetical protein QOE72_1709 [Chloroflexota bacterium]|nr:hypothetical protein [Chloroflexota bacterium]